MIWPRIVTKPTGQAGLALTVRDRVVPVGTSDFSNRCCLDVLPGHDVVLFSPQKRTDDSPTLAISRLPVAWRPNVNPGIRSVTRIRAMRGPGTSSVTKEPIWLMTVTWPWAVATGLTRKPTKWRSE